MNNSHKRKITSQDYRTAHHFFIDPITGDVRDAYSKEVVLNSADRHEDSPPLVHHQTGQIFHPWTGEILNITHEQALDLKEQNEFFEKYYQQLEYRQNNRIKGDYETGTSQHHYFIHPTRGDIYDINTGELMVRNAERSPDRPPIVHPISGQIYDTWTGEALNLSPREIISIKRDIDNVEYSRQQRAEERRKEQQHKHDE